MPIDPQSGGTWIAVNDAGLVMTLLNANPKPYAPPAHPPKRSRGLILPALIAAPTFDDACTLARMLQATDFARFRLVIADRASCAEFYSDGAAIVAKPNTPIDQPLMFTSSGLGDNIVEAPRRVLFSEFFTSNGDWPAQQDAYHRHSWPDRPDLSVCMSRPEACTVSLTVVELGLTAATMTYYGASPNQAIKPITIVLPLIDEP
jgi:hypothetical protein